jgi:H+-transporting ATPase
VTLAGTFVGFSEMVYCTSVLAVAKFHFGLGLDALRTVAFLTIVFGNQAGTYANRGRQQLRSARPSLLLIGSSLVDVLIGTVLAVSGVAMARLPLSAVGAIFVAGVAFALILIVAKVPVFRKLNIA